jgi:multidrug efflux pump subunit AcrA (membrane-fusion protein)
MKGSDAMNTIPQDQTKKKRHKIKKSWIILAAAAALVAIVLAVIILRRPAASTVAVTDTTLLSPANIQNTISATGTVASSDNYKVYSTLQYPVKEIYVSVGSVVQQGDKLCQLDSDSLKQQIQSKEASMGISAQTAALMVQAAENKYSADKEALGKGINASLVAANSSVNTAYTSWVSAKKTYDDYYTSLKNSDNPALLTQKAAVDSASSALANAKLALNKAESDLSSAEDTLSKSENTSTVQQAKSALNSANAAVDSAEAAYSQAVQAYNAAKAVVAGDRIVTPATLATDTVAENIALQKYTAAKAVVDADIIAIPAPTPSKLAADTAAETAAVQAYNSAKAVVDGEINAPATLAADQAAEAAAKAKMDTADTALSNAKTAARQAEQTYNTIKDTSYDTAQTSVTSYSNALDQAEQSLKNAQTSYDNANAQYEAAAKSSDNTLAGYELSVNSTYQSYLNALSSLKAAQATAVNEIKSDNNSLQSSEVSANNSVDVLALANLNKDLQDTTITAPISGTVTAVYANVGSNPANLMFVIENANPSVDSTVKEYDIDSVKTGMAVTMETDATGTAVYEGKIISIAPASAKDQSGATVTGGDINYDTKIEVLSQNTGLHIGMDVRLKYILAQQIGALAVPYDAVYTNAQGEKCILAAVKQSNGRYILKEYVVVTGLENDLNIVISGDNIVKGLRVLNVPGKLKPNSIVTITGLTQ